MADKQISSLPAATSVDDGSLFVVEQQGAAMSASGALWKATPYRPYSLLRITRVRLRRRRLTQQHRPRAAQQRRRSLQQRQATAQNQPRSPPRLPSSTAASPR